MPIKIQSDLPAKAELEEENIFVMDENRAISQNIRPLEIIVLNLMPIKQDTELQLLRGLSNTPLQIDVTFLQMSSHVSKNTSASHIKKFYQTFEEIKNNNYDGMIITGAPVEKLDFEEVNYWDELITVMEWSNKHVTSTIHICWGAQAGLYYHYGIKKELLPKKLSGVYKHRVMNRKEPLVRGFDDVFMAPHSRYTQASRQQILDNPRLKVLADSDEAGIYIVLGDGGKEIFVMGHPEYDRLTLDQEYKRDIDKGIEPDLPVNYYPDDDCNRKPLLSWRSHANNLYTNWLNYYVYQITPYDLNESYDNYCI
ncbi:homoserine O-succinyltransferase [Lachnospira eligens]|uniref:Homoserine O-acetyltransferase n=1 Tax=Lachnospira eligens (strain ATCC 27750 / DSM 3376 / VPI C15-48 / C15-B4) TaxID=515620 RepID=METAA_LACE2|nr:homoserine O-succinyltransferase [Lachnospira eligens]C4Z0T6.1 RecName: Full=Homoserine O-acetyltransferase; Short=HAT; AltName: Full=Homoserine transacetylase; Short=HTA [[Eubacterium] eligens ATCC 27750]ACR72199.1 homoserine O-succinyltransferase [[Eubacterium] eligens ATCC 27750]UEA96858.1 homoserine O-succinyltransferase [Lachnospira eligens]